MSGPIRIWLILDGKPGHENQAVGLVEAMAALQSCEIHRVSIADAGGMLGRIGAAVRQGEQLPRPDLVVGAGHRTHGAILWLSRKYQAKSIVLMKPSLPVSCFDRVICPEHDFPRGTHKPNVMLTRGAINRVVPASGDKDGKLVLVGGPSKIHGWDDRQMIEMIERVTRDGAWKLADSRRTPESFTAMAQSRLQELRVYPHAETESGWLAAQLQQAREVWVTEDSVSMVYEAVTSGADVGLLPVPRLQRKSRVLWGLDRLVADGYVTRYEDWVEGGMRPRKGEDLCEARRCAGELLGLMKHGAL